MRSATGVETIAVATWNLRHFGDDTSGGLIEAAAFVIEQADADLIAIQEVRGEGDAVRRLARQLGRGWRVEIGPITGNHERLAFLYDSRVVRPARRVRVPMLDALDCQPLAMQFRSGGFDFTLVNVHLLAGDEDRRRAEAETLVGRFTQDRWPPGERDVLIVGDLNTQRLAGPTMSSFKRTGWSPATASPTNANGTRPLDHILLPAATTEWTGEALVTDVVQDISDHAMVVAWFRTTGVDDD
ncbi:MAG: endonuclease/exonuclease/phosphatase family protein [Planctomycetota bacterium]